MQPRQFVPALFVSTLLTAMTLDLLTASGPWLTAAVLGAYALRERRRDGGGGRDRNASHRGGCCRRRSRRFICRTASACLIGLVKFAPRWWRRSAAEPAWTGPGSPLRRMHVRVTYYGQACTLIEAGGRRILTDPWLTEGAYLGTWFHTHVLADAGITPATIAKRSTTSSFRTSTRITCDPETLRHFDPDIPVLICRFPTPRVPQITCARSVFATSSSGTRATRSSWTPTWQVTIYGTAEYTNDSAIVVRADGCTVFNETDCKLSYADLQRLGDEGIDIGFYMFSGANWYPMLYDYPSDVRRDLVQRRRRSLLSGLVQRVKLTRPKLIVPAAGPCTVLDPESPLAQFTRGRNLHRP